MTAINVALLVVSGWIATAGQARFGPAAVLSGRLAWFASVGLVADQSLSPLTALPS